MNSKARKVASLILIVGLLLGLYLLEEQGPMWLVSVLNWLAGLSGFLSLLALCGCLFVSELTRQRRMALFVFGLGSFGVCITMSEWLQSDVPMACETARRILYLYCTVIENTPHALQSLVSFAGFLIALAMSFWLAQMGWSMYRYRALR